MEGLFSIAASHDRGSLPLEVLAGLTLLRIVPFLLVMCTSFVRIVVVLVARAVGDRRFGAAAQRVLTGSRSC